MESDNVMKRKRVHLGKALYTASAAGVATIEATEPCCLDVDPLL